MRQAIDYVLLFFVVWAVLAFTGCAAGRSELSADASVDAAGPVARVAYRTTW